MIAEAEPRNTPVPVRSFPVARRIFSFPAAISSLLVVLATLTMRSRFVDPDMWWHMKLGEVIWTTHSIPITDLFSFTTSHHASIPHEWLSQLLIYAAFHFAGYTGLMLWLCALTSSVVVAGYALCWLYSGNAKVSLLGALTVWLFGSVGFAIRPQLIGYLFLILELMLIHLGRTRDRRWFFALPPLFAVWVNCHGSFFLGLIVAAIFFVTSWLQLPAGLLANPSWQPVRRRAFAWSLALTAPALCLTPVGIKQALYPLDTMLHQPIGLSQVSEWQPLQFSDGRAFAFLGVLLCIVAVAGIRRASLYWHEVLLLALGAWLAASHQRMLFPFGILAAPVLTRVLADSWENYNPNEDRPLPNAVLIATSLLVALLAFPSRRNLNLQVAAHDPVKAVEFLKSHPLPGPMLNEWIYGGYLIWAAPQYPDFIDGRADVFEWTGVIADYGKWITLQSPPAALLDQYRINFCILSRNSPASYVLPLLPNWKTVYSDDDSIIFARVPPAPSSSESPAAGRERPAAIIEAAPHAAP